MHNRTSIFWRGLAFALILLIGGIPHPAAAQQQPGVLMTAKAGFDGSCKDNTWIPVLITLENKGPDLDGQVEIRIPGATTNTIRYTYPVSLPGVSRKEFTVYIFPETYMSNLEVSFISGNKEVAVAKPRLDCLTQSDLLFGVLSENPSIFNVLADLDPPNGTARVAPLALAELPDKAQAWESLDVLVISNIDTGALTLAQRDSLAAWVSQGGQLIITGGPDWQKTAAGLGEISPLAPSTTQNLKDLRPLQSLSGSLESLSGQAVVSTGSLVSGAEIIASQDKLPLIAARRLGSGQVYYLAADPSLAPLKNWDGMVQLYRVMLAQNGQDRPGWAYGISNWSQASTAASTLPNIDLPSGFLICGFLVFYVTAIGPLNYLVLKKRKRGELAWISIPVLVVLFSIAAITIGQVMRGNSPVLNRLAIVQVKPGAALAEMDGIVGVYSPSRSTYRLKSGAGLLLHPIPSYDRSSDWTISETQDSFMVNDLRVDVGGVTPFAVEGFVPAPRFSQHLSLKGSGSAVTLEGSITNESSLTLQNATLLAPGGVQNLGVFQPGETRTIQMSLLISSHASIPTTSLSPSFTSPSGPPGSYTSPAYYSGDTTIQDIIGTPAYYDSKENYRRYSLLSAALTSNYGNNSRGAGIYLSGWCSSSPVDLSLERGSSLQPSISDTTLYLISISPDLQLGQEQMVLTPGLYSWSVLETSQGSEVGPYNSYLNSGSYTLQFDLAQPVHYSEIKTLSLDIRNSSGSSFKGINISLWDYAGQQWVKMNMQDWGSYPVPDPPPFVGPGGQVRMHLENTNYGSGIQIQSADFILVVGK